jgi:hypothetical protein
MGKSGFAALLYFLDEELNEGRAWEGRPDR